MLWPFLCLVILVAQAQYWLSATKLLKNDQTMMQTYLKLSHARLIQNKHMIQDDSQQPIGFQMHAFKFIARLLCTLG